MMTLEELRLLTSAPVRAAIEANRDRDPLAVALDRSIPEARLVATQLKYLARAATKLPRYAAAGCILPPRAFEQASSEACAASKRLEGRSVLDLTCGLGVDARALAERFERVVTLERDPVLAAVARTNFARLGARNIEVVEAAAEAFVARTTERFDWIYADPDRRSAEGRKLVRLEDCSPDIRALYPQLKRIAPRLCLKNSPLFDVAEAQRLFPTARIEVLSLAGECKEVVIYDDGTGPALTATALGLGSYTAAPAATLPEPPPFDPARYRRLIVPDVALQKARLVRQHLAGRADCYGENGYGFTVDRPQGLLGRIEEIERIEPFDPRALKRELKGLGVELLKRDFPHSVEEMRRRTGLRAGSDRRIALTKIGGACWTIRLK